MDTNDDVASREPLRVRPVADGSGESRVAVDPSPEVSPARVAAAHGLGLTTYGQPSGWAHDASALALLGMDDDRGLALDRLIGAAVVPQDRAQVLSSVSSVLASGGRVVTCYRVAGVADGDPVRWIQSIVEVDLDAGGELQRLVATHVDVSMAVAAAFAASAPPAASTSATSATVEPGEEQAPQGAASFLLDEWRTQRHNLVELLSEKESRERMLLADAVHDQPIQLIAAAQLRLSALRRRLGQDGGAEPGEWGPRVVDETERVSSILGAALERLRGLIAALTPPDLSDGLLHAIGEVAEATFRDTGTTVSCTGPAALSLTPAQQDAAMRILQEALANVRQHAQARRVIVRVSVEGGPVVLTVEDDGVGSPDVEPTQGHLGLMSMYARAADAGALLAVSSAEGVGTSVVLRFPLAG